MTESRLEKFEEALRDKEAGFEKLAAEFRALTSGRVHTPAEILQSEGRKER